MCIIVNEHVISSLSESEQPSIVCDDHGALLSNEIHTHTSFILVAISNEFTCTHMTDHQIDPFLLLQAFNACACVLYHERTFHTIPPHNSLDVCLFDTFALLHTLAAFCSFVCRSVARESQWNKTGRHKR